MLVHTEKMLLKARQKNFAVGAFNIYNLEGALAVINAAEEEKSPVIIQILPSALTLGGSTLIKLCLEAGRNASIPAAVHLDHCSDQTEINRALEYGMSSVMADGSGLEYADNIKFTKKVVEYAGRYSAGVEAELGMISGSEDGLTVEDIQGKMTRPDQVSDFVEKTGICALAVCIGNIHGKYRTEPRLDFGRLKDIADRVSVPLVLHGTSGLPDEMIIKSINHGVCKFNVNTEVRISYLNRLKNLFHNNAMPELVEVMREGIRAMKKPVREKMKLFGSVNKASQI